VPRACIAVRMVIGADGTLRHRFVRGLMRSRASLKYAEVQAAQDGAPSTGPRVAADIIAPLYAAYAALAARGRRASRSTSTCRSGASS
jgi:ribonuclease R